MKVAFVGCGHGNLDLIYSKLENQNVDLLIVCGDFEACRNELDLHCLAGPSKYHFLKDYWKYYKGTKQAPILTLFIGGNHEASNHLWELYYGGWAAPNIYFLGYSGVIKVGDLRVGGISGIYNVHNFYRGHNERLPYNDSTVRSIYHTRQCEIWKMLHVREAVDVMISHDWPKNVVIHGDKNFVQNWYKRNPALQADVESGKFGSPASEELMNQIKPTHWVSGHMHVHFQSNYPLSDGRHTKFLALSKSIENIHPRDYLAILDFPDHKTGPLSYDEEWLAILRATHTPSFFQQTAKVPKQLFLERVKKEREIVKERYKERGYAIHPSSFEQSIPPAPFNDSRFALPVEFTQNGQSAIFILELGLPFAGFEQVEQKGKENEQQEKEKEQKGKEKEQQIKEVEKEKTEEMEMVNMVCGSCKKDWTMPKKAMLAFEQKNIPPPAVCKNCQRKKNVQSGWK